MVKRSVFLSQNNKTERGNDHSHFISVRPSMTNFLIIHDLKCVLNIFFWKPNKTLTPPNLIFYYMSNFTEQTLLLSKNIYGSQGLENLPQDKFLYSLYTPLVSYLKSEDQEKDDFWKLFNQLFYFNLIELFLLALLEHLVRFSGTLTR